MKIIPEPQKPTMDFPKFLEVINRVRCGDLNISTAEEGFKSIHEVTDLKKISEYQIRLNKKDSRHHEVKGGEEAYVAGAKIASLILCNGEGTVALKGADEVVRKIGVPVKGLDVRSFNLFRQLGTRKNPSIDVRGDENPVEVTSSFKALRNNGFIPETFNPNTDWDAFKLGFELICWIVA